jgi:zinc protease
MIGLTPEIAATSGVGASRIQRLVTPKGLEAWLIEEHAVPLVAMTFSFEGGAAQDPAGLPGAAYIMASLLDEGAGSLNAQAFQEQLEEFAVELSVSAGRDRVEGTLKTLTRHQADAFRLLRLALTEPRFDADALARVKAQASSALRRAQNDPGHRSGEAWNARAFKGHAYANPVRGTLAGLETLDRDTVAAMATKLLVRGSLRISIVGSITAASAAAMVDEVFGDLPAGGDLTPVMPATVAGLGETEIIDLDIPQSTIRFGMPGLLLKDPDYVPAVVLNHILGGGSFTSRLWQEVREKRGLAYSVNSSLYPYRQSGIFYGGTATKNERAREALDVIREEIARMAATGPTEEELDKAKRYLVGSYALRFDTSTKIAAQLDGIQVENLGIDYMERRNGEYQAVTLDDLKRVSSRLLGGGQMLVTVAGRPVGM